MTVIRLNSSIVASLEKIIGCSHSLFNFLNIGRQTDVKLIRFGNRTPHRSCSVI